MLTRLMLILAALMLGGCGANFTSIYRDYKIDSSGGTTTVL